MCGIVFAGSNTFGVRDTDFFESLLYHDIIRGDHSTGVFAGFSWDSKEPLEIKIRKAAVPADVFLRRKDLWDEIKEDKRQSQYNANAFVTKSPKFMVGHNRYATMGEIIDANAHPFKHGAVTLVHNGTLDNQSLLPDHEKFKVDSENVCYSIDKIGIEETIKKLHGKFTLVWFDERDQTLNFLRNKDRPFHFIETSTGDWFGASEEDMIMWLSKRPKGVTAKRHFEAEVGTQYVFDCSNGGFRFKEERKHELPVFRYQYSGYQGTGRHTQWAGDDDGDSEWERYYERRGYSSRPSNGPLRQSANGDQTQERSQTAQENTKDRLNNMLEEHGVGPKIGECIFWEAFQFEEYPNGSKKGKMTGYMNGKDEYIEVQAPGVQDTLFKEGGEYVGKILSCYIMNYILHVVVAQVRFREEAVNVITLGDMVEGLTNLPSVVDKPLHRFESTPPDEGDDEEDAITEEMEQQAVSAVTADGTIVTKKEWESNGALNCCANCSSPIPWEDAEDATVVMGNAFCADCDPTEEAGDDGYPKDSGSDGYYKFRCKVCGNSMHEHLESSTAGVCVMCNASQHMSAELKKLEEPLPPIKVVKPARNNRDILKIRRKLQNGMIVTKAQWETGTLRTCWCCKADIPWEDAEVATFMNGRTICEDCDDMLSKNRLPQPTHSQKR